MDDEHPEWLPVDWKVCVRVRSSGKKDKYYIDPLNGLKCNSKPEVLRYLKNAENDRKLKESNKTNFQKTVAEKLPSGWIKEIRITKKSGKTRRDPYYIDPVSGRHFRSMQEVNRYLETKDSRIAESRGDDTNHPSEELGDHSKSSTVVAEGQRLIDNKEDKILAGTESIMSEGGAAENINLLEAKVIGQEEGKDSVGENRKQEKVAPAPQNKRKKSNCKWMNGLPRRTSKRLSRVEANSLLELETCNGAREVDRQAEVKTIENSGRSEINTSEDFGKQKEPPSVPLRDTSSVEEPEASNGAREAARPSDKVEVNTIQNTGKSAINISGDFGKQKEPTNVPLRDISSSGEHEAVGVDFKKDDKNEKDLDTSLNDLLMDPCIEFAIKTLTGAIPIEEVNKVHNSSVASRASPDRTSGSSCALPFGDIWADPCFEFAVKTLTSEIPMEDDSHFRISLERPLSSSGASGCNSSIK